MASDFKTYKIKNIIIAPFILAGLVINSIYDGFSGTASSISGILLPFLILILLYALRMLGAGDIKLFCAIGSIMGVKFVLYAMAWSFLCGGVMAIIILCLKKNGRQRISYLFAYLKNSLITLSFTPYTDFADKSDASKFHFSYAIACGVLVTYIMAFYGQGFDFFRF